MIDLDKLQAAAEAAIKDPDGRPWQRFWDELTEGDVLELIERVRRAHEEADRLGGIESRFMGAAEERDVFKIERDEALARIARVEALHRRYGLFELEDSCPDISYEHREEHHHECADEVGEFYCDQMPVGAVCDECRTKDGERVDWPCPTVRALTEGENE
ncbi:hypothetical protein [Leucobacter luti]|uniref:Uncharacterized protein n=1 Tax=Leucobacter luti TaxID=340320 RepID=A0A4V6MD42_9MICO|nr:hypothetical protein [Leucobacter luti]MBL3699256.1 hypothetical protein [Leucobacter luti]RZT66759.1 hypothetical protein EV139_0886 [Leucobacter luti]